MKALIQRVDQAEVSVDEKVQGAIRKGLLVLLGVDADDDSKAAEKLASKVMRYRIFADQQQRMNASLLETGGELLVVSQFTLSADTSRGLRPGFSSAAQPATAKFLYEHFVHCCREHVDCVETGVFGADMRVSLVNNGPVTFLLEV